MEQESIHSFKEKNLRAAPRVGDLKPALVALSAYAYPDSRAMQNLLRLHTCEDRELVKLSFSSPTVQVQTKS